MILFTTFLGNIVAAERSDRNVYIVYMLIVLSSLAVLLFFALSCGVLRVILKDHNGDKPLGFVVFNPQ